jgi:outer membrane protein assembly factor BamB
LTILGLSSLCLWVAVVHSAQAEDWPQWFGPKRDGVWREQGILDKFPEKGPKVLWRTPLGNGFSGPAVVNGRVYVLDRQRPKDAKPIKGEGGPKSTVEGKERVLCLSTADGKVLWTHEYDCTYVGLAFPFGPRLTPIVSGGKVYTLGAMGDLLCLDAEKGKVLWSKNFPKDLKAPPPAWGWAAHPLLIGDKLYCLVGGEGSAVVAFDKDSGKELWRSLTTTEVAYSPPILVENGKHCQLIVWLSESINGLDPETGKPYWSVPYPADGQPTRPSVNIMMPRLVGNLLFVSGFYHGSLMVELDPEKLAAKVRWRSKSLNPGKSDNLHGLMTTAAVKDGYLYGVCAYGQLRCLKPETGEIVWESMEPFGGEKTNWGTFFITQQGERHFLFRDTGDLIIARLTPKGYEKIDQAHLLKATQFARGRQVVWCPPAYANRCMFVRNDEEIICVSLTAN